MHDKFLSALAGKAKAIRHLTDCMQILKLHLGTKRKSMHKADTILKTLLNLQAGYPMATEVHYKDRKTVEAVIPI